MVCEYECEHCDYVTEMDAYDDQFYHENIIPKIKCPKCGEVAPDDYRPLTTKYPEGYQI